MRRNGDTLSQPMLNFQEEPTPTAHDRLPDAWARRLPPEISDRPLARVAQERTQGNIIYPPAGQIFTALKLTPPEKVRAVILGQDPYHEPGQAFGLAFAVPANCPKFPPSLRNILREYESDWGQPAPLRPDLSKWAIEGVLMLNTILTVRAHEAFSHRGIGWESVTDAVLQAVSALPHRVVFILWGAPAQAKRALIDETRHAVITSAHPSPLSAYRGFFGSRPFTTANRLLTEKNLAPLNWTL